MGDKLKSHGPEHPEWEASSKQVGDKLQGHGPEHPEWGQVGDKLRSHGPEHPGWEASGRQLGEKLKSRGQGAKSTQGGKQGTSGRQVKNHMAQSTLSGSKWETIKIMRRR